MNPQTIMKVEQVIRFKGTILVGRLECDVRVGDPIMVGEHVARIFAIESICKIRDSACTGEDVAIMVQNIQDVPVEKGWKVSKPDSNSI